MMKRRLQPRLNVIFRNSSARTLVLAPTKEASVVMSCSCRGGETSGKKWEKKNFAGDLCTKRLKLVVEIFY